MCTTFHHYSFNNILLICSQRPDATRVAGFHTWRKLKRFVKKGEKGILIFAPIRARTERLDRDEARGNRTIRANTHDFHVQ
jgi:hypothetical protein